MANWTVETAANNLADVQSALQGEIDPGALHRLYPNLSDADLGEVAERALAIGLIRAAGSDEARIAAMDAELARRVASGQPAQLVLDTLISFVRSTGDRKRLTARLYYTWGTGVEGLRAQTQNYIDLWNQLAAGGFGLSRSSEPAEEIPADYEAAEMWWIL